MFKKRPDWILDDASGFVPYIDRTDKLVALLAIAFCWSYGEGLQLSAAMPARIAKTRFGQSWPAESKFHQGLQYLQEILLNPIKLKREFMRALAIFVP